jgi:heat shock protein HslJ
MRRPRLLLALALVGCFVTVTACSGGESSSSPSSSTSSANSSNGAPLRATNWVLTDQVSLGTPLDGVAVSATFDKTQISGHSGCNGYFGPYTVHGSAMTIGPNLGGTQIACTGAPDAVERAYLARLVKVTSFAIDGETLTLSRAGKPLLVYRASEGAEVLAGGWNATSLYTGNAVESPAADSSLTLEFAETRVSGNSGCNTFGGAYKLSGRDGTGRDGTGSPSAPSRPHEPCAPTRPSPRRSSATPPRSSWRPPTGSPATSSRCSAPAAPSRRRSNAPPGSPAGPNPRPGCAGRTRP